MTLFPKIHILAIASLISVVLIVALVMPATQASIPRQRQILNIDDLPPTSLAEVSSPEYVTPYIQWQRYIVKPGDSLAKIFQQFAVSASTLAHILDNDKTHARQLAKIYPGQELKISVNDDGELERLRYQINDLEFLEVARQQGDFEIARIIRSPETETAYRHTEIQNSLFADGADSGVPINIIMQFAAIFQWDIDFVLDTRAGDSFSLVYEERFLDGKQVKADKDAILVAQFTNQGETYTAIRYNDENGDVGYFTPEGNSFRKAFLRAPLDFIRISSNFNLRRKHPILKRVRPHRGIDYAAPNGTPIRATGDGKIIHKGRKGSFGKLVVIQHGQQYKTKYAHLSRYAKNMRNGKKVKQGQIIGYVGATGAATGPHLHYEFLLNGVHRNPRTVLKKIPQAKPIAKARRVDFSNVVSKQLAILNQFQQPRYASNDANNTIVEG